MVAFCSTSKGNVVMLYIHAIHNMHIWSSVKSIMMMTVHWVMARESEVYKAFNSIVSFYHFWIPLNVGALNYIPKTSNQRLYVKRCQYSFTVDSQRKELTFNLPSLISIGFIHRSRKLKNWISWFVIPWNTWYTCPLLCNELLYMYVYLPATAAFQTSAWVPCCRCLYLQQWVDFQRIGPILLKTPCSRLRYQANQ